MQKNIPALTGLRFLAALTVILAHGIIAMAQFTDGPRLVHALSTFSAFGMSLFFVLSGFVIHYTYHDKIWRPDGFYNFIVARFARLYPVYILLILVELALTWRAAVPLGVGYRLSTLPYYLTLTQSWAYGLARDVSLVLQFGPIAQVSWSISTEWWFYLAYPMLLLALMRLRRPVPIAAAAIVFIVAAAVLLAALKSFHWPVSAFMGNIFGEIADGRDASTQANTFFFWLVYFSPYVRIFEFAVGCFSAHFYLQRVTAAARPANETFGIVLTLCAVAAIVIVHLLIFVPGFLPFEAPFLALPPQLSFGFAPGCALLIYCCARYRNALVRPFSSRVFVTLGDASYSIYLLHMAFFIYFRLPPIESSPANMALRFLALAGVVVLIFATSLVLFRLVEMPARKALRRLLSSEPSARDTAWGWRTRATVLALAATFIVPTGIMAYRIVANLDQALARGRVQEQPYAEGTIDVLTATYGAVCVRIEGNATASVRRNCNGLTACDYVVRVSVLGDPAPGCGKDFRVEWRCSTAGPIEAASLPAEAGFRSVAKLSCSPRR